MIIDPDESEVMKEKGPYLWRVEVEGPTGSVSEFVRGTGCGESTY